MAIFDYIFFRITNLYISSFKDKNGEALGALFVTLFQIFIIGLILLIFALLSESFNYFVFDGFLNNPDYKLRKMSIPIIVLGFNFYRYFQICNYGFLKVKWINEDSKTRYINGWIIAISVVLIFISMIFCAVSRQHLIK